MKCNVHHMCKNLIGCVKFVESETGYNFMCKSKQGHAWQMGSSFNMDIETTINGRSGSDLRRCCIHFDEIKQIIAVEKL